MVTKRHQRGLCGDHLIPEKKRKTYVPPVSENYKKFRVGNSTFKSQIDACRKLDVNYVTFRKRKGAGWTDEEALELKPRKRGKLYNLNGEFLTIKEISEKFKRKIGTVSD